MQYNTRVLIVDDQEEIHIDFQEMLLPRKTKLVSDDLAATFLMSDLEEKASHLPQFELAHASSGDQACELIKAARDANQPFAVAYIDIRMPPGMDGIETIRQIRTFEEDLEIVIMTAYTDKPLPEIITDMKLLHKLLYIRKPVAREEIQQITLSLVEKWNIEQGARRHQNELLLSHKRLETLLDAIDDAIQMTDSHGRHLLGNQAYTELLGISNEALREMSLGTIEARLASRLQKPESLETELGEETPYAENILEERRNDTPSERRLFYRSVIPIEMDADTTASQVIIYRDMSKDAEIQRMRAEVMALRTALETLDSFGSLIGKSEGMQRVYARIRQAADSNIAVLIQGESGTGKELVARSIHANSTRGSGPFIAINCAAIPETLIESELFGHEAGAFTGATARRIGKFEQADKGTLFLDEIGDMQPALQAKLLRVLQDRQFQRLGGTSNISTDIRVIAATNRNLDTDIKLGSFREDLYYRLAAFLIVVPPLRERREDIALLARHFLKKFAASAGKSIYAITPETLQVLVVYNFPGNVRELENAIESAVLLETTDLLQRHSLPFHIVLPNDTTDPSPILTLEQMERSAITRALKVTDNNISHAAQQLGIARSTLHRKLKEYGLLK